MGPRMTQAADAEPDTKLLPNDPLRPRLVAASKEELVALVERLTRHSEELATRIDYITSPSASATAFSHESLPSELARGSSPTAKDVTLQRSCAKSLKTSAQIFFQPIARRRTQGLQRLRGIKLSQLARSRAIHVCKRFACSGLEQRPSVPGSGHAARNRHHERHATPDRGGR